MNFQIKSINQLDATTSPSGFILIPVDLPDGGGGFNIRKLTKADLLKYNSTAIPTRVSTTSGLNDILFFKEDESAGIEWLDAAGAEIHNVTLLGVSDGSGGIPAQMTSTGRVECTALWIANGPNQARFTFPLTTNQNIEVRESGDLQVNAKSVVIDPSTGSTVNIDNGQWLVYFFDLSVSIAALTINMPNAPRDGYRVTLYFADDVTTITHNGTSGNTIQSPLTSASAGDRVTYIYVDSADTWLPIS